MNPRIASSFFALFIAGCASQHLKVRDVLTGAASPLATESAQPAASTILSQAAHHHTAISGGAAQDMSKMNDTNCGMPCCMKEMQGMSMPGHADHVAPAPTTRPGENAAPSTLRAAPATAPLGHFHGAGGDH